MAEIVRMPKLSDTMTEGVVAEWHKKVGDMVEAGDLLAEIETDKATMEFESFQNGVLLYIGIEKGKTAPVDSILAILGEKNEDIKHLLKSENNVGKKSKEKAEVEKSPQKAPEPIQVKEPEPQVTVIQKVAAEAAPKLNSGSHDTKVKASPLAKKLAKEKGIDISLLKGTGNGGRIVKRDIEVYQGLGSTVPALNQEKYTEEPLSQMRKTIAKRLQESKFSSPHFYLTIEIDMDRAMDARKSINEVAPAKISFNHMIILVAAEALSKHPKVNANWLEDRIRYNEHINIGVAVAVDDGLIVPVIRYANGKSLVQIASESRQLIEKANNKKLQPEEFEGNTFTVSNLGMAGIEEFTAIINPPDACIMAVGMIKETPVVKNGEIVVGHVMKATLSCDHRVVDGATGAEFLQTFKQILENPLLHLALQKIGI